MCLRGSNRTALSGSFQCVTKHTGVVCGVEQAPGQPEPMCIPPASAPSAFKGDSPPLYPPPPRSLHAHRERGWQPYSLAFWWFLTWPRSSSWTALFDRCRGTVLQCTAAGGRLFEGRAAATGGSAMLLAAAHEGHRESSCDAGEEEGKDEVPVAAAGRPRVHALCISEGGGVHSKRGTWSCGTAPQAAAAAVRCIGIPHVRGQTQGGSAMLLPSTHQRHVTHQPPKVMAGPNLRKRPSPPPWRLG